MYRISVKESLSRSIKEGDDITCSLEILPVLEKKRMSELLIGEFLNRGFKRDGSKVMQEQSNGVILEVNTETGVVSLLVESCKQLELSSERAIMVDEDNDNTGKEQNLRDNLKQELENKAKSEMDSLRKESTKKLESSIHDIKKKLDDVVNKVTIAALKIKAAELGQVESIHETENGEITIKVKV
jgi:hypothetical protein